MNMRENLPTGDSSALPQLRGQPQLGTSFSKTLTGYPSGQDFQNTDCQESEGRFRFPTSAKILLCQHREAVQESARRWPI